MSITTALRRIFPGAYHEARDANGPGGNISFIDWANSFRPGMGLTYNGSPTASVSLTGSSNGSLYDANAVVFACEANRILLFSEARFQFQQLLNGRPGDLFGTPDLAVLEEPWVGATTRDLLAQAELDILMYGNSYWIRDGAYLLRLEPGMVTILTEAATDDIYGYRIGERLLGYGVKTKDATGRDTIVIYEPGMVAHYKPYPDKNNRFVGTSWLSACLPDVQADQSMQEHKTSSLNSGAKLGIVVSLNGVNGVGPNPAEFEDYVQRFRALHEGPQNAGKTVFLAPGSDVKTIGQTFDQLNVKATQGAGETRIAACAGVPPVIVGLSEGLASATYSNYGQARRRLVDGTMRPLWGFFASAMQSLVAPPNSGARLWYDDRDIPFLREDVMDQAEIRSRDALTMESLVRAGWNPDTVRDAVVAGDFRRLTHTGLYSVQLQPPAKDAAAPAAPQRMTLTIGEIQHRVDDGWTVLELNPAA